MSQPIIDGSATDSLLNNGITRQQCRQPPPTTKSAQFDACDTLPIVAVPALAKYDRHFCYLGHAPLNIISLSSHRVPCAIGDYNADLKMAFESLGHIYDVHALDRGRLPTSPERNERILATFAAAARDYCLAVIQHEFSFYGESFRESCWRFARLLDLVHGSGKLVALFIHTAFPELAKLKRWEDVENRLARRAIVARINRHPSLIAYVHGRHAKAALTKAGVKPAKIAEIAFPMSPREDAVPPRPLGPDEPVTLLMFGFIARYKGYETALAALRLLPAKFRLLIAGDRHPAAPLEMTLDSIHGFIETGTWHDRPNLKPLPIPMIDAERESFRRRITLLGYVENEKIAEVINAADIVLAPYNPEGAPDGSSAVGLALAFGKPVIASTLPAFTAIRRRANCVQLVPPGVPFELAAAIRDLAADHSERVRMSEAALKLVRKNSFGSLAECMIVETAKHTRA